MKKVILKLFLTVNFIIQLTLVVAEDRQSHNVEESEELHQELRSQSSCNCGVKKTHRIVGGKSVKFQNEIPWRCALFYKLDNEFNSTLRQLSYTYEMACGCSILSKKWVLTAAHCIFHENIKPYIYAGSNRLTPLEDDPMSQPMRVKNIFAHPDYDTVTKNNDIALLELSQELPFGEYIAPVCLPYKHRRNKFYKKRGSVSGFGITKHGTTNTSEILRKVELPILTTKQCRNSFQIAPQFNISENMLCTFEPRKDACQGDSGAGLDFQDEETGINYVIGIVSWGVGCASRLPGVYTKVAKYLRFIENTSGQQFCRA